LSALPSEKGSNWGGQTTSLVYVIIIVIIDNNFEYKPKDYGSVCLNLETMADRQIIQFCRVLRIVCHTLLRSHFGCHRSTFKNSSN